MSSDIAVVALVVGLGLGSSSAVGALGVWSGYRARASGPFYFGLWFLMGSLAILAFVLWLFPPLSLGLAFLGVVLGLGLVWLVVRGRLSHE